MDAKLKAQILQADMLLDIGSLLRVAVHIDDCEALSICEIIGQIEGLSRDIRAKAVTTIPQHIKTDLTV